MSGVTATIQARMGSSRLPGKALVDICGVPAMTRVVNRLRACRLVDDIVLATSTSPTDDPLAEWGRAEGVPVYRGSEDDVLGRMVQAQQLADGDTIVLVTGDCILLDPEIIDLGVMTYQENDCDAATNVRKLTYPMGLDVQVIRRATLEEVERTQRDDPAVREHVALYVYENPELFRVVHIFAPARWTGPEYRFQLDYPEDLAFIREIYQRLGPSDSFGTEEIFSVLRAEPELLEINIHREEKSAR